MDIVTANEELNRWCGTKNINYYEGNTALGFLFKHAVPRLEGECWITFEHPYGQPLLWRASIKWVDKGDDEDIDAVHEDVGPALFWAISKVKEAIGGKE